MPKKVIIDTDPGVDDALALILASRSPELELVAVTSVAGNVPVETATANMIGVLALDRPEALPVFAQGAAGPLRGEPVLATFLHGPDGLGGAARLAEEARRLIAPDGGDSLSPRGAAGEIVHQLRDSDQSISLIALGPLTNVALALELDPEAFHRLERLVVMGGAVEAPGNMTPAAEFNFYADPEAAAAVLASGLPTTLVGLDVTAKALLPEAMLSREVASHPSAVGRFVQQSTAAVYAFQEEHVGHRSMPLHDPLAVAAVVDPDLLAGPDLAVAVETEGRLTRGMSLADRRQLRGQFKDRPNAAVCLQVDAERFLSLFKERVLWPRSSSSAAPTRT